ncbi:helix-turn-helix domain-containing protein [Lactobacillus sp. ESL0791]|uniref:helix-turn-helix domain-containing protein n=1 Tax=Lactobacillus sp. ESL0791 TaxID=2983234 RepID=UPI0023F9EA78|nr:Rgg/GadR/MutR family transcriptional regulator [Lactobacillus sp. ESL0791]MDF7639633.1 helix-turn-helix domain-containing protein [Lactobacillus sp. ESL0791]
MTIAELLKNERLKQKKTQAEWAGDIISQSYYARVEKGKNHISADDLIALLNYNQVNLSSFFNQLNPAANEKEEKMLFNNIIVHDHYNGSIKGKQELKKTISQSNLPNKKNILLYLDALIADGEHNIEDLDEQKRRKIREMLLDIPDLNKEKLTLFTNLIGFYDLDDYILMAQKIIEKLTDTADVEIQDKLLAIIINILSNCIASGKFTQTKYFIQVADSIPTRPELFFDKNFLLLFENLINYHYDPQKKYLNKVICAIKNFTYLGLPYYGHGLEWMLQEYVGLTKEEAKKALR